LEEGFSADPPIQRSKGLTVPDPLYNGYHV
jgi:hypothetical protein